jgi:hypothetical protein
VTPAKRGKGGKPNACEQGQEQTPSERRASMCWAQRLKRVFNIDVETCRACGDSETATAPRDSVGLKAVASPCSASACCDALDWDLTWVGWAALALPSISHADVR